MISRFSTAIDIEKRFVVDVFCFVFGIARTEAAEIPVTLKRPFYGGGRVVFVDSLISKHNDDDPGTDVRFNPSLV